MTFDIGHIISCVAVVSVPWWIAWWYGAKEKRRKKKNLSQEGQNNVSAMIGNFFDSDKLSYDYERVDDSIDSFIVGFEGKNGEIMMRVYVMKDRNMYQIIGQQKTFIPASERDAAMKAINGYNMQTQAVSGCISKDGAVTFWIGRYTYAGAFSRESFACEFSMVLAAAEDITDHILKAVAAESK